MFKGLFEIVDLNELDPNDPDLPKRYRKLLELKAEHGDAIPDRIPYMHPALQIALNLAVLSLIVLAIVKIVKWCKSSS